jgi:hypothetical protein
MNSVAHVLLCVALWNGTWKNCTAAALDSPSPSTAFFRNLVPMAELPVKKLQQSRKRRNGTCWDGEITILPKQPCLQRAHTGSCTYIVKELIEGSHSRRVRPFLELCKFCHARGRRSTWCTLLKGWQEQVTMRDILCGRREVWVNLDSVFKASIPSFCEIVVALGLAMLRSFCVACAVPRMPGLQVLVLCVVTKHV